MCCSSRYVPLLGVHLDLETLHRFLPVEHLLPFDPGRHPIVVVLLVELERIRVPDAPRTDVHPVHGDHNPRSGHSTGQCLLRNRPRRLDQRLLRLHIRRPLPIRCRLLPRQQINFGQQTTAGERRHRYGDYKNTHQF